MPKKATKELSSLSLPELKKRFADFRKELYELRFQKMTGKLENYRRIREVRRNIARALTILKVKERENKHGI